MVLRIARLARLLRLIRLVRAIQGFDAPPGLERLELHACLSRKWNRVFGFSGCMMV